MAGKRLALLIGNCKYTDRKFFPVLTKPAQDVRDLAELLRDPEIGGFNEVQELLDQPCEKVKPAIERFFQKRSKDDLLLLYFSGHGYRDAGKFYLIVRKSKHDLLGSTAVEAPFICDQIDLSASQRKVIVLDCCHSGAFTGEKGRMDVKEDFTGNGYGRIILTAAKATETAQELAPEAMMPHSLFTHFVIDGLRTGAADIDQDGKIAAEELFEYVAHQLSMIAAKQTPQIFTSKKHGELVIARNPHWQPSDSGDLTVRLHHINELITIIKRNDPAQLAPAYLELQRFSFNDPSLIVRGAAQGALEEVAQQQTLSSTPVIRTPIKIASHWQPGDTWTEPVTDMEFVWIPPGQFMMGQMEAEQKWLIKEVGKENYQNGHARELPRHQVTIAQGFWLGKYPVTNAEYRKFDKQHDSGSCEGYALNGEKQPVVQVSWDEAVAFIEWLNTQNNSQQSFRLPSEAEWEYACRAGTDTMFFWGNAPNEAARYANGADQSFGKTFPKWAEEWEKEYKWKLFDCDDGYAVTSPVGSFEPNPWGLYDMLGNVWEWCADTRHDSYNGAPTDGSARGNLGDKKAKILRGGSWLHPPPICRCAYRDWYNPVNGGDTQGFRVVAVVARTL